MKKSLLKRCPVLLLALLFWQCDQKEEQTQPPNVVFFLVDDLGWSDIGCYGSSFYETPNIDKMASQGVRFTDAYAAAHVCSPTRASILTGKYPATVNLTDWLPGRQDFPFQKLLNVPVNQQLPLSEYTLAEALKDQGYSTAMMGKWHLGEDPYGPTAQGFDIQIPDWNKGWPLSYHAPFRLEGLEGKEGDYLTDRLTDKALEYIEANQDKPFFLYLSHFAVHDPIQGRQDLVEKYADKLRDQEEPGSPGFVLEENPDVQPDFSYEEKLNMLDDPAYAGYGILPNNMVKIKQHQDNVQFASMVSSMDESLGRIMDKLEALGIAENTLVVFYSDNGGMSAGNYYDPERQISKKQLDKAFSTSNLPLRGAKGWLYEGGIRVPLIVKWPGKVPHQSPVDLPVSSPDLYPTILEMLGLPAKSQQTTDGHSFASVLRGEGSGEVQPLFWHFPHYSNHGMQSPGGAVRYGDYKLLEYYENNTVQLFNLKEDIGEKYDLSEEMPDKVAELKGLLNDWREKVSAHMMEENPEYTGPFKVK